MRNEFHHELFLVIGHFFGSFQVIVHFLKEIEFLLKCHFAAFHYFNHRVGTGGIARTTDRAYVDREIPE